MASIATGDDADKQFARSGSDRVAGGEGRADWPSRAMTDNAAADFRPRCFIGFSLLRNFDV
jgi:hypothetical protein